jgi:hypothetical protein
VERIEERILPGDTLGWAFLESLGFLRGSLRSALIVGEEMADPTAAPELHSAGISDPLPDPAFPQWQNWTEAAARIGVAPDDVAHVGGRDTLFAGAPLWAVAQSLFDLPAAETRRSARSLAAGGFPLAPPPGFQLAWNTFAHDGQHTALSDVPSQSMAGIHWQTPVDLMPHFSEGGDLLIHYGSPLVTAANTVIVPVKIHEFGDFRVEGRSGRDGSLIWTQTTDYILPDYRWIPSFSPTLTPQNRLYFPGAGGTLYYRDNPDSPTSSTGQIAFYGIEHYTHAQYDDRVFINTPITTDHAGNIYFGFQVTGPTPINLQGGIARIGADGVGTWMAAAAAAGDPGISKVVGNSAPALSNDESVLYVAVNSDQGWGYLLALDSASLAPLSQVALTDPGSRRSADLPDNGTASPTVGPDGDVYFGVLENPIASSKGWLLHFSFDLSVQGVPGAFGWDNTASVVPSWLVPSYTGSSTYLLMSKYNNYAAQGGDGVNKIAILDPNDTQIDQRTGVTVMKEVLTHAGVTPDPEFPQWPNAVREWCINNAAVDPFTRSVIANSEDGKVYRWDLASNSFTEVVPLTEATGEAYTPTVIGVDGTVYAINLFAVGV